MSDKPKYAMAAIGALVNQNPHGDDQILVFYNNQAGQLNVEILRSKDEKKIASPTNVDPTIGLIRNPSQLAVIKYQNLIQAYAIAEVKSELVLLSPGYNGLRLHTEKDASSLAACGDDSNAWIFYLKNKTVIQYELKTSASTVLELPLPVGMSNLAASYNDKLRHLIYQPVGTSTKLYRYECSKNTFDPIKNSDNAAKDASIAVCGHPDKSQIHIYYNSKDDKYIHRISWTKDGGYSPSIVVNDQGQNTADFTNIAVAATATDIHVFYVFAPNDEERSMAHVIDTWA